MNDYMVEVVKVLHIYNDLNKSVVTYAAMVVGSNSGSKMWDNIENIKLVRCRVVVTSQLNKYPSLYEIEEAVFSDLITNGFTVPKGLKCLFKKHIGKTEEDDGDDIY